MRSKKGTWSMVVWLILALIITLVSIGIIVLSSNKSHGLLGIIKEALLF